MKSERSLRIQRSKNIHKKESNSPTLTSSYSQKRILSKIFKNQPFPKQLKRRLIGHRFKFSDFSDEEQQNSGVVEEEDEHEVFQKKKKLLPHFKIMSDHGEFVSRGKMRSQKKYNRSSPRCKSVQSLKLPQVVEEKKQQDQQRLARSKLSQFKDKNQFNQHSNRNSETNSLTDKESMDMNYHPTTVPEKIIENEAEQTKSQKLKNDKSIITSELQKLIVDQIDDRKKKKDQQQQIEEIIQQEKQQEQILNVNKLRISLQKLQHETEYLSKFKEEELRLSRNGSQASDRGSDYKQKTAGIKNHHQETIKENHQ